MQKFDAIILAGGQGKRMKSGLPKVLQVLHGRSMLEWVVRSVVSLQPRIVRLSVVVCHNKEQVIQACAELSKKLDFSITCVDQGRPLGTGHAVQVAFDKLYPFKNPILVLPGDMPLVSHDLLEMTTQRLERRSALRLVSTEVPRPTGYGRLVRDKVGKLKRIVEEKDATTEERAIREVNASVYFFDPQFLKITLPKLAPDNVQKELYLTDTIGFAQKLKKNIESLKWADSEEVQGVNDPWERSIAEQCINSRILRAHARNGVKFIHPQTTWVDPDVQIAEGVVISQNVILEGNTVLGSEVKVGPNCVLKDTHVGNGAWLKGSVVSDSSSIGVQAVVGPFTHLRPHTEIGAKAKIGNFVELKKAKIGENTSIAHLSYLGDAQVGASVNIGCGFVTCNYDGVSKHSTVIEDGAFVGSDCQVVAPIRLGANSYVASGSTLTQDVPSGALAVARSRQINKAGYASKYRKKEK